MPKPKWSKGQVSWLVNRLHCSTTEAEIREHFAPRMTGEGWTERDREQVIAYAIKAHEDNRQMFRRVSQGSKR